MLQTRDAGGARLDAYAAILGRNARARPPWRRAAGPLRPLPPLPWPRMRSAIFLLPRAPQAGPAHPRSFRGTPCRLALGILGKAHLAVPAGAPLHAAPPGRPRRAWGLQLFGLQPGHRGRGRLSAHRLLTRRRRAYCKKLDPLYVLAFHDGASLNPWRVRNAVFGGADATQSRT